MTGETFWDIMAHKELSLEVSPGRIWAVHVWRVSSFWCQLEFVLRWLVFAYLRAFACLQTTLLLIDETQFVDKMPTLTYYLVIIEDRENFWTWTGRRTVSGLILVTSNSYKQEFYCTYSMKKISHSILFCHFRVKEWCKMQIKYHQNDSKRKESTDLHLCVFSSWVGYNDSVNMYNHSLCQVNQELHWTSDSRTNPWSSALRNCVPLPSRIARAMILPRNWRSSWHCSWWQGRSRGRHTKSLDISCPNPQSWAVVVFWGTLSCVMSVTCK